MTDSGRDRLARGLIDDAFRAVVEEHLAEAEKREAALKDARKAVDRARQHRRAWRRQGKFDYVLGLRALAMAQAADLVRCGGPSGTRVRALASYLAEHHPTTDARAPMHAVRRGSGKPLLLIHGLGSSWHNWDLVLPALSAQREVIAVDLPGFGETPPLSGDVTIATLTDAVVDFVKAEKLGDVGVVGSSMGARMVLELARRGHAGNIVALDPGGFWSDAQVKAFNASITASVALIRHIQPTCRCSPRARSGAPPCSPSSL